MLKIAVGHSDDPDTEEAIADILAQCMDMLADASPQAGLLFAAIDFDHALLLQSINHAFPTMQLIGCTTDGELSSELGFRQDSVTLIAFASDTITMGIGLGENVQEDAIAAAQQAVHQATPTNGDPVKFCITVPASYNAPNNTTNGELILQGLDQALGGGIPIFGGLAGDQWRFQTSYQFFQSQVRTNTLPVLTFSGPIQFSYDIGCGWQTIGPRSEVTQSDGPILYKIGHQSALDFYRQYLGDRPPNQECPLAVFETEHEPYYIRTPNLHDPDAGSITFLGNVPENSMVQLTEVNREQLVTAAELSMKTALARYPGSRPDAALIFSCCCRRWVLGTRSREEYQ